MLHALTSPIESVPGEAAALAGGFSLNLFHDLSPGGRQQRRRTRGVAAAPPSTPATVPEPATTQDTAPRPTARSRERAWPVFQVHAHTLPINGDGSAQGAAAASTQVIEERCLSLLRANDSAAARGSLAANPYRGCSIGCLGCSAASPQVHAKLQAADRLRDELRQPRYHVRPLQIGSSADAYQPVERDLRLTRSLLELLHDCGHPVILVTRSPGVLRDLDLLVPMAKENRLRLLISLCTLDNALSAQLEPHAALPAERLSTLKRLSKAGIPVGLHFGPIWRDSTAEGAQPLLEAAARAGATHLQLSHGDVSDRADAPAWQREFDEQLRRLAATLGLDTSVSPLDSSHFQPPTRREPVGVTLAQGGPTFIQPGCQSCLF